MTLRSAPVDRARLAARRRHRHGLGRRPRRSVHRRQVAAHDRRPPAARGQRSRRDGVDRPRARSRRARRSRSPARSRLRSRPARSACTRRARAVRRPASLRAKLRSIQSSATASCCALHGRARSVPSRAPAGRPRPPRRPRRTPRAHLRPAGSATAAGRPRRVTLGSPRRDVDVRVRKRRPVPVDENRAAVAEAQVVAAHIEMAERVAVDLCAIGRVEDRRQRALEPFAVTEADREERPRVGCDRLPAPAEVGVRVAHTRRPRWGLTGSDRRNGLEHRRHAIGRPSSASSRRRSGPRATSIGRAPSSSQPSSRGRKLPASAE